MRLLDLVNSDGYMDVVIGNNKVRGTRLWFAEAGQMDQERISPVSRICAGRLRFVRPDRDAAPR